MTSNTKPVDEVRIGAVKAAILAQRDRQRLALQRHLLPQLQGQRGQLEVHFQLPPRRSARCRQGRRPGAQPHLRAAERRESGREGAGRVGQCPLTPTEAGLRPRLFLCLLEIPAPRNLASDSGFVAGLVITSGWLSTLPCRFRSRHGSWGPCTAHAAVRTPRRSSAGKPMSADRNLFPIDVHEAGFAMGTLAFGASARAGQPERQTSSASPSASVIPAARPGLSRSTPEAALSLLSGLCAVPPLG